MKLPCTLVVLTHSAQSLPKLEPFFEYFDSVLIWHDSSSQVNAPLYTTSNVHVQQHSLDRDFAAHRNAALEQVTTKWCFFVDQDEWFTQELLHELSECIDSDLLQAVYFPRYDVFLGKQLTHGEVGSGKFLRCAQTDIGKGAWKRAVHERWEIPTDASHTALLETPLWHQSAPTYTEFLAKLHAYAQSEPQSRVPQARWKSGVQFFVYPVGKFLANYIWRAGYLDGWPGFVHALTMAYYSSITRVFLYETHP